MLKTHNKQSLRNAFTLMELLFVIVIVGILTAVIIPRDSTNRLHEAATQLVSHIRYTQHLAMIDDKFNKDDSQWYESMWQIRFTDGAISSNEKVAYAIFSDWKGSHTTHPEREELARDPLSGKLITGGVQNTVPYDDADALPSANLGNEFGINDIELSANCRPSGSLRIAFDHIGRPIKGSISAPSIDDYNEALNLITDKCIISICLTEDCATASNDERIEIVIEPETGYTHIL